MIEPNGDVKTGPPVVVELTSVRGVASGVKRASRRKRRSGGAATIHRTRSLRPLTILSVASAGAEVTGANDNRSRSESNQSVAECCDNQIAALYVLAYIRLGEHEAAETAVVEAIARAAGRPVQLTSIPISVWHLLATHFHGADLRLSPTGHYVDSESTVGDHWGAHW